MSAPTALPATVPDIIPEEQFHAMLGEPLGRHAIAPHILADLLDAGLNPRDIDRLRFARWRHERDGNHPHRWRPAPDGAERLVMGVARVYPRPDGA